MTDIKTLMLDRDALWAFTELKPHQRSEAPTTGIKRIKPKNLKPRQADSYYIRIAIERYEQVFYKIFKQPAFQNSRHKFISTKSNKVRSNIMRIVNYLLDYREEHWAWNDMTTLLEDYFTATLKAFNTYRGRRPTLHNMSPGPKNTTEYWRWVQSEEVFLGAKYLSTESEYKSAKEKAKPGLNVRPDDPWLDRCALLSGNPPLQRPNRYLMLEDNNFVVIAEPLHAAQTELIAYDQGAWLYRVIVDQIGNVVEIKETER